MQVENVYIAGKLKWLNADRVDEWGKWRCVVAPTTEEMPKIQELLDKGIKNELKKDDDGYYIGFNKPCEIEVRGKKIGLTPPEIFNKDGTPLAKGVLVGRGSDITLKVEISYYVNPKTSKRFPRARFASLRIDNLVPYEPTKDYTEEQTKQAQGLMEQPEQPLF